MTESKPSPLFVTAILMPIGALCWYFIIYGAMALVAHC